MIVNDLLLIRSHNDALRELIGSGNRTLRGLSFGEAVGCINACIEQQGCGETTKCRFCTLHNAMRSTQSRHVGIGPELLQRSVYADGRIGERTFSFITTPIPTAPGEVLVQFDRCDAETARQIDVNRRMRHHSRNRWRTFSRSGAVSRPADLRPVAACASPAS